MSYNLSYDYSIYEVTDIPLNDHVAHYFTTAHPDVFGDSGDVVVVRARNLGGDPMEPVGQVDL